LNSTKRLLSMDPFRQLWLDQVQFVVDKKAGSETLHELLRLASPSLSEGDAMRESSRVRAFKELQRRIHPDKHLHADTTKLFQDVLTFYDRCCESLMDPRRTKQNTTKSKSPTSVSDFPQDFHVQDKWSFLDIERLPPLDTTVSDSDLAAFTAAMCINARGAISHGQKTNLTFGIKAMNTYSSVEAAFDSNGGTKHLSSIDAIKKEIIENGPVVSTSFVLRREFLSVGEYSDSLLQSRVGNCHELLLIGWNLTAFGEVWLARPLHAENPIVEPIRIAFGQFGVNDLCIAPKSSFDNTPWQLGPYFDAHPLPMEWLGCSSMHLRITSSELEDLAKCFDKGLVAACRDHSPFVIRNKRKFANSRSFYLSDIQWDKDKSLWEVVVNRIR
jgi:hypothetical protein